MSTDTDAKPLSSYLQAMVKANLVEESIAAEANALPTHTLQETALDRYRDEKPQLMKRIVAGLQSVRPPMTGKEKAISVGSLLFFFGMSWVVVRWLAYGLSALLRPWFPSLYTLMQP